MNIKNWFRKIVLIYKKNNNKLNSEQQAIIDKEIDEIKAVCGKMSSDYNADESKHKAIIDGKCPHCGNTDIVNKITRVQGEGSVSGSFSLGFGSVYGSSHIDTNEVNNCTKCGNQWKKYEFKYKWTHETLVDLLNDIPTYIEGTYDYPKRSYDVLKNFHAETIFQLIGDCSTNSSAKSLYLSTVREHFKSVFDVN